METDHVKLKKLLQECVVHIPPEIDLYARVEAAIGMGPPFVDGQRVRHESMGMGTVIKIEFDAVTVEFDNSGAIGCYDNDWFLRHPGILMPVVNG